jgi:hypothetical protein
VFELELSLSSSEELDEDELELLEESEAKPVLMLTLMFSASLARSGSTSYEVERKFIKKFQQTLTLKVPLKS